MEKLDREIAAHIDQLNRKQKLRAGLLEKFGAGSKKRTSQPVRLSKHLQKRLAKGTCI